LLIVLAGTHKWLPSTCVQKESYIRTVDCLPISPSDEDEVVLTKFCLAGSTTEIRPEYDPGRYNDKVWQAEFSRLHSKYDDIGNTCSSIEKALAWIFGVVLGAALCLSVAAATLVMSSATLAAGDAARLLNRILYVAAAIEVFLLLVSKFHIDVGALMIAAIGDPKSSIVSEMLHRYMTLVQSVSIYWSFVTCVSLALIYLPARAIIGPGIDKDPEAGTARSEIGRSIFRLVTILSPAIVSGVSDFIEKLPEIMG
jgi:hypothetical protein